MKKLLILLFSFFLLITPSAFADDISDFEIEGISIGDSLLDYLSYGEITTNKVNYFQDERQYYVVRSGNLKLKIFDSIEFYLKKNDSKFIINYFVGFKFYRNNFDECKTKKQKIVSDIKSVLNNSKMVDEGTFSHAFDKSGKSTQTRTNFYINSDYVSIECLMWSQEIKNENPNWSDNLGFIIGTNEVMQWIKSGYK